MDGFPLFLTGMQRSGTTLLEKLLGLLSQPFPLLFVEAKRDFLRGLGRSGVRYPLGHLFLEDGYRPEDFHRHLEELRFDGARLQRIFEEMQGFSGQYTRVDPAAIPRLPPRGFAELLTSLYRALSTAGSKETICEEFLPYFLDQGWRCALILRDPRDVVASLNHGRGPEYGGRLKPTVFNVRNWRKSVAYALHLEGTPGFLWLRYEDLVADPGAVLQAFGLGNFETGEIRGWTGNSSHGERLGVSAASVGAYRKVLSPEVIRFIEAACLPEMRLLGYPVSLDVEEAPGVLRDFKEPYEITREGMESDITSEDEVRRLELLGEDDPDTATRPWFLFERAHARLRKALP